MRTLTLADLKKIEAMHQGSFPLPDLSSSEYIIKEVSDQVNSFAAVKMTTEVSLIVNPSCSSTEKARLIKQHFESIRSKLPVSDTHVFVTEGGEHFAKILCSHFGFERATGIPLYWSKYGQGSD
jgi:hypothetical protein